MNIKGIHVSILDLNATVRPKFNQGSLGVARIHCLEVQNGDLEVK